MSRSNSSLFINETVAEIPTVYILLFKTNIRFKKDIKVAAEILSKRYSVLAWNIDKTDIDRVLRIESASDNSTEIILMIRQAGYYCEELAG